MKKYAFILTLCFFLIAWMCNDAVAQVPSYVPTSGLLAWYPFNSSPNNVYGAGNNGVVYGGVSYGTDRFGSAGSCYVGNGSSGIDIPFNDFPAGNDSRSVSVWFKLPSSPSSGNRSLFATGSNIAVGRRFGLVSNGTSIGFESVGVGVVHTFTPDTAWHNIVVTYPTSGTGLSSIIVYFDGAVASSSVSGTLTVLATDTGSIHCIGMLFLTYLYSWVGELDDIGVWNREISPCEVSYLYYSGNSSLAFVNGSTASTTVCEGAGAVPMDSLLAVNDSDAGILDTWSIYAAPTHGTLSGGSYATTATGTTMIPTGFSYTPTAGFTGSDSFKVIVNDCGTMADTITIHVSVVSATTTGYSISGYGIICVGTTRPFTSSLGGGVWSSSNTAVATIGSSTGEVTGITVGTSDIVYTLTLSCRTFTSNAGINVRASPDSITGPSTVCPGATISLSDATTGGTWSSSPTGIATVASASGIVTGVTAGVSTLSYTIAYGCSALLPVTVAAAPAITGARAVCQGMTTVLSDAASGGTWSSGNTTIAVVGSTGIVTGESGGVVTISYSAGSGCPAIALFTINPLPASIAGSNYVNIDSTITLGDLTSGGTWSSSSVGIASVTSGGAVTGVAVGSAIITYAMPGGCSVTSLLIVTRPPSTVPLVITTVAGDGVMGVPTGGGGPAILAELAQPTGLALDAAGNIYCSTIDDSRIHKVNTAGIISTIAGNGLLGYTGDGGPATAAEIFCYSIAIDAAGNLYLADNNHAVIRKINTSGIITTIAGGGTAETDGVPATMEKLFNPGGLASDAAGNLYFSEDSTSFGSYWHVRIRMINTSGIITTIAGTGSYGFSGDGGPAAAAMITGANQISVDHAGNIYLCDAGNKRIRKINSSGIISTVAGNGVVPGSGGDGGLATAAELNFPDGVVADYDGNIFISDGPSGSPMTSNVRKVNSAGIISVYAGTGISGRSGDGCPPLLANLNGPAAMAVDTAGNLYFIDIFAWIRKISPNHPPHFTDGHIQSITLCGDIADSLNPLLGAIDSDLDGTDTWSIATAPMHGTVVASYTAVSLGDTMVPTGLYYTPASGYSGTDSFRVRVTDCVGASDTTTIHVTINVAPVTVTGVPAICSGSRDTLTDLTTGGAWSSSNTTVATIGTGSGMLTGAAAGTTTISYTLGTGCGATATVTINAMPGAITGTASACAGATTALSDAITGGTWSSGNTAIATVGSSTGIVTGESPGIARVAYTLTGGCMVNVTVTVSTLSTPISGPVPIAIGICGGATIALTDATTGGAWSSSSAAVASVGVVSGLVTGGSVSVVSTATITYTAAGGCAASIVVTVNPQPPAIFGASSVCAGSTALLSEGSTGPLPGVGSWSSSSTAIATVGSAGSSSTGIAGGVAGGMATISYTLSSGCTSVFPMTVAPQPSLIMGVATVCISTTGTFTDITTGGIWSSSNTAIATIEPISGIVTASLDTGTTAVSYTLASGCAVASEVTVNIGPLPITGVLTLCNGGTTVLSDVVGGGAWSNSSPGIATVDPIYGTVYGIAAGTTIISYSIGSCVVTAIVTVNSSPASIGGVSEVCVGLATLLSDATTGGTWSSSNASIASIVAATGILTGGGAGTATISYTLLDGCATTRTETVNTTPSAITGVMLVCPGAATVLSDGGGGSWSSSDSAVATVGSAGVVSGITAGTASIIYAIGAGCSTSAIVTVNPLPAAISGTTVLCAGATTTLSDPASGGASGAGAWSSGSTGIATAGSTSGIVSGVAGGTALITYTSGSTGCSAHTTITINPLPLTITGALAVCQGATTLLSDHTTGGIWSSSATAIATVSSGAGTVSGVAAGTAVIVYANPATGCATHATVTVNPLPLSVTGTFTICAGASTTLLDGTSGGTWSASGAPIAIGIEPVSGVVNGISAGTAVISYTLPTGCAQMATVTVNAIPGITGPTAECVGAVIGESIPIAIGTTGGTWSSSVTTVATVGSSGGVTGVATGTTVITYTSLPGCKATATITVSLSPGGIIGASALCAGDTTTLSDAVGGGVWSSSNSAAATVGSLSGTVTGVAVGTTIITYSLGSTGCTVTKILTVSAAPAGITGVTSMCAGATTALADATTGGVWSSSGSGIATVNSSGDVRGVATGTTAIIYTHGGCAVSTTVTVNLTPTTITGGGTVCAGALIALSDAVSGGAWSSSNTVVASVDATGDIFGTASGTAIITYSLGAACAVTKIITVNPISPITGSMGMCLGTTTVLSDAATGGTWSSGASSVASVGSASSPSTGIVTGVSAGTSVITYTIPIAIGTGCSATATVTVNLTPSAISGVLHACVGATTTLGNTAGGGAWTSSNTAIGTIGSTGIVTGIIPGTTTIIYSIGSGCTVTAIVTINAVPAEITGITAICGGTTTALSDASTGGVWSPAVGGIATVSGTGIISGVSAGTVVVSYEFATGCMATALVTINPVPAMITGTTRLCAGLTATLSSTTTGGAWSSSGTSVAGADPVLGIITGAAPGTAVITYALPSGCSTFTTVTINAALVAIAGPMGMCIGSTVALSNPSGGGAWSSGNTVIATIDGSGVVTGTTPGTATISYTAGGCAAMAVVTVNSLPDAISGTSVCLGSTETLTDMPDSGTWSSSDLTVGIGATTGIVTGASVGTATIVYSLGAGCTVIAIVTVEALPGAITGTPEVCMGFTTSLTDAAGGGVWSSGNTSTAIVSAGAGGAGAVTGISGGAATISYTSRATGCAATRLVTVVAVPAISGVSDMCAFSGVATVSDAITGGTWTSTSVTVSTAGVVTPYSAGAASLTYTIPLGCYVTASFTVHPLPGPVTGISRFCRGGTVTLGDTTAGGVWSSGNSAVAEVSAGGAGAMTGLSAGTAIISYSLSTGCMETETITVDSFPVAGTITGATNVCVGETVTLAVVSASALLTGSLWSSSNTSADVLGGVVSGVSAGVDTIKYTISNTCGTASALKTITVNTLPVIYAVTGGGNYCAGAAGVHIGLSGSNTGVNYQLYHGSALSGSSAGTGIAADLGLQTAVGVYTVVATNVSTGCSINMPGSATVTITPAVIPLVSVAPGTGDTICAGSAVTFTAAPVNGGGTPAYQWLVNNIVIPGATAGLYTYAPVNGDHVKAMLISSATCAAPDTVSDSMVMAVVTPVTPTVTINASPGTSIQQGQNDTLTATISGSSLSPSYQWEINGNPIAGATMASFTSNYSSSDTVDCIVSVGGICNSEGTGSVVILVNNVGVNILPKEELIRLIPNPNNGTFTIKGSLGTGNEEVSLEISDLLGQSIYKRNINAPGGNINTQLSLSSVLARGVYILRLTSGATMHTFRVIVE